MNAKQLMAGTSTDIRNEITQFTADNLPENVALRESLLTQHQLINVIENMAEKGAPEIGTNILTRFSQRNPLIGTSFQKGMEGVGLGSIIRLLD